MERRNHYVWPPISTSWPHYTLTDNTDKIQFLNILCSHYSMTKHTNHRQITPFPIFITIICTSRIYFSSFTARPVKTKQKNRLQNIDCKDPVNVLCLEYVPMLRWNETNVLNILSFLQFSECCSCPNSSGPHQPQDSFPLLGNYLGRSVCNCVSSCIFSHFPWGPTTI